MKHIEFLGAPGSGKSALAEEFTSSSREAASLAEATLLALRTQGSDPLTRLVSRVTRSPSSRVWKRAYARSTDRFAALTRFIASHPTAMEGTARTLASRHPEEPRQDLVLSWLLNLMAQFQLAMEVGDRIGKVVIDEGFCQRAVALYAHGFNSHDELDDLEVYIDSIPRPDAVVVVETPLDLCEERLDQRGWSERAAHLDGAGRREFLANTSALVEAVVRILEVAGVRLLRVDGSAPMKETAQGIAHSLT